MRSGWYRQDRIRCSRKTTAVWCISLAPDSSPGLLMFTSIDWSVHLARGMADVVQCLTWCFPPQVCAEMLIMYAVCAGGSPLHWRYHIFVHRDTHTHTHTHTGECRVRRGERKKELEGRRLARIFWEKCVCVCVCVCVYWSSDTADTCHLSSSAVKLNWHKQPRAALSEMDFT